MAEESLVIFDNELVMDVNNSTIINKSELAQDEYSLPMDELNNQVNKLEDAITNLESSLDPNSTSSLSQPNREGIYLREGLLTNIVLGIVVALIIIILVI